jgi:hypothetical protein
VNKQEHTPQQPYCRKLTCWCHFNKQYHELVTYKATAKRKQSKQFRAFVAMQSA